ncbi:hypothetical protein EVAR_76491_1 [Eumeta japonica]|uniref:Uncharacterized protein n=1 Tax=Eumeta variegata TaxID=151549 RepID=A0A4C1T4M5_EUMVA|nr:hypothetical protein EVAR_76491_1 [Eumeta japonica]
MPANTELLSFGRLLRDLKETAPPRPGRPERSPQIPDILSNWNSYDTGIRSGLLTREDASDEHEQEAEYRQHDLAIRRHHHPSHGQAAFHPLDPQPGEGRRTAGLGGARRPDQWLPRGRRTPEITNML